MRADLELAPRSIEQRVRPDPGVRTNANRAEHQRAVVDAGLGTETEPLRALPPIEHAVGEGQAAVELLAQGLVPPLVQGQQLCFERLELVVGHADAFEIATSSSRTTRSTSASVSRGGRGRVSDCCW